MVLPIFYLFLPFLEVLAAYGAPRARCGFRVQRQEKSAVAGNSKAPKVSGAPKAPKITGPSKVTGAPKVAATPITVVLSKPVLTPKSASASKSPSAASTKTLGASRATPAQSKAAGAGSIVAGTGSASTGSSSSSSGDRPERSSGGGTTSGRAYGSSSFRGVNLNGNRWLARISQVRVWTRTYLPTDTSRKGAVRCDFCEQRRHKTLPRAVGCR